MTTLIKDTAAHIAELMAIDKSALPADGGQRFNRLIFARSPYLLQHAENPVDWYEWGPAAFDRAQTENLPILLSIGYATCHWCHVMAHESFEDDQVAALLNRHFVCIKVDREERPDIDDFYMTVSQLMTGSGGWPLNIFMAPDRRPFMAITYLPKQGRSGMSGLMELLANIATLWRQRPDMIENNCRGIMEELARLRQTDRSAKNIEFTETSTKAFNQLSKIYDPKHGGFGSAPKFPMPIYLGWLIAQGRQGNAEALEMALHTLRRIRNGGIWDQLAGGVHRYSVDQRWLAPHFEKMLYDQAMLALVAIDAFQATGDPFFSGMAAGIFEFAERELRSVDGGYCSALDADSEGVEGRFYVWDKQEIDQCLGPDSELFCRYFDISSKGNFEGMNIPNIALELEEFCRVNGTDPLQTGRLLERGIGILMQQRAQRIRPLRDDKIIAAWNGLMIAALSRVGIVCGKPDYLEQAAGAARFIMKSLRRQDGRLLRCWLNGASETPAFLEDYAFMAFGLLELYEATLETSWLDQASSLAAQILALFCDPYTGEFVLTGLDAEQMPARASSDHDGVTPSALAVTARVLLRLAWTCDRPELIEHARKALSGIATEVARNPLGYLGALSALSEIDSPPVIASISGPVESMETALLLRALKEHPLPRLAIRLESSPAPGVSICADRTCFAKAATPDELKNVLRQIGGLFEPQTVLRAEKK
ncbi:MAG: thioredoxin domain-containing protein [Deltaproteobacteria bacterium]|nr:thioredoxin domain-containing protein [Deltaproteobacteria bacterium]